MNLDDAILDLQSIKDLNGTKILIKGNHDYWWSGIGKVRDILPENFYALQNEDVRRCSNRCYRLFLSAGP